MFDTDDVVTLPSASDNTTVFGVKLQSIIVVAPPEITPCKLLSDTLDAAIFLYYLILKQHSC